MSSLQSWFHLLHSTLVFEQAFFSEQRYHPARGTPTSVVVIVGSHLVELISLVSNAVNDAWKSPAKGLDDTAVTVLVIDEAAQAANTLTGLSPLQAVIIFLSVTMHFPP